MKAKILISLLLITAALIYSFKPSERLSLGKVSSSEPPQAEFILGAMSNVFDNTMYNYLSDSLNFNMWHLYAGPIDDYGWTYNDGTRIPADSLGADTNSYGPLIKYRITQNSQNELMTLMTRPVITYFAYGQRSDYQMEESTKVDPYYFFYTYNFSRVDSPAVFDIQDYSQYGSGEYVKRCVYDRDSPGSNAGLIVSGLKGNKEQANTFWDVPYLGDKFNDWYVMPRIRIDSVFANNPQNKDIEVCKIIITNWVGDSIIQVLQVKNFKEENSIYDGKYIEEYFPIDTSTLGNLIIPSGNWFNPNQSDPFGNNDGQIDFKVHWYAKCDMWIDRIRVENEPARRLMTKPEENPYLIKQLEYEIKGIALSMRQSLNSKYQPYKFYIEEFEMNHLPSIGYVNKMIRDLTNDSMSLMVNYNYDLVRAFIPDRERYDFTADMIKRYLIDSAGLREIFTEVYGLEGWKPNDPIAGNDRESYNPPTLNNYDNYDSLNGVLVYKANSVNSYEYWLQTKFQSGCNGYCQPITFNYIYKLSDEVSRISNVPFIYLLQAHSWWYKYHKLKEPTNEEISLQAYLALAYGAKGIMYFAYNSHNEYTDTVQWGRGLAEHSVTAPYTPRYLNAYGQEKWKYIGNLNKKIKDMGPYLLSFENSTRKSYINHISSEFAEMSTSTYIKGLKTYPVIEIDSDSIPDIINLNPDVESSTYLQASFFQKENDTEINKYFMIVNRRCSPFFNFDNSDSIGGRRFVAMKINSSQLPGFNNWKLIDIEKNSTVVTINKYDTNYFYVGDFMPGEGKLYKLAPVMQEGGTLVADESISGVTFNCNGNVYSSNKNISLYTGTNINFADGVKWNIIGGEFKSGLFPDAPNELKVNFAPKSNSFWKGLKLQNSDVNIVNSVFSGIKGDTAAIQLIDCFDFNVSYNEFNLTNSDSLIIISADFVQNEILAGGEQGEGQEEPSFTGAYIINNEFNTGSPVFPAIKCFAYDTYLISLVMNRNIFNSTSGNLAVLLSNIASGNIKNNKIYNYNIGFNVLSPASYSDFYNNIINGDSIGIQVFDGIINLGMQDEVYTGGFNQISTAGTGGVNLISNTGWFHTDLGSNTFNINDTSSFHFSGTFDSPSSHEESAVYNCFKILNDFTEPVLENVGCPGENCDIVFIFEPEACAIEQNEEYMVIELSENVYDTIYFNGEGSGGGKSNSRSSGLNYISKNSTLSNLYPAMCLEMRKRNYESVKEMCYDLLTDNADSLESLDAVSKLYFASFNLDSAGSEMNSLKSFYESLIINNSSNFELVKRVFYLIQKCKVSLGQYQSAMTGFQQIVNENPYNYLGLVASWDYAATSLIAGLQGGSGGGNTDNPDFENEDTEENFSEDIITDDIVENQIDDLIDDPQEKSNKNSKYKNNSKKSLITNSKVFQEKIFSTFKNSRDHEIQKIKDLQSKVETHTATKQEKSEYESKRILNSLIRTSKPENIYEHINSINTDIQKLFSKRNSLESIENKVLIPTEYNLSQNYPNPFNPTTKINFSLPEDGKIKLTVYDILGREVKRLINSEFRSAGRYTVEFIGTGLSSGVYFYKLEAGKFVQTKRMVLIK